MTHDSRAQPSDVSDAIKPSTVGPPPIDPGTVDPKIVDPSINAPKTVNPEIMAPSVIEPHIFKLEALAKAHWELVSVNRNSWKKYDDKQRAGMNAAVQDAYAKVLQYHLENALTEIKAPATPNKTWNDGITAVSIAHAETKRILQEQKNEKFAKEAQNMRNGKWLMESEKEIRGSANCC